MVCNPSSRFDTTNMDSGSVVSEPISAHHRAFAKQKSASMTILNPKSCAAAAKYGMNNNHGSDIRYTNGDHHISSSASHCATTGRRRKGASLGGTMTSRTNSRTNDARELRSALQDREAVIQNLRIQLCLGKLPRPTGPPLDDTEKPAAEQKLQRLKTDAENKKIKIRNLKSALDKLDITDNIDIRIRQAELEYALGREELQMLSIVEEARALQARLEKSKPEAQTIYSIINSGVTLSLHAVHATSGRWAAQAKPEVPGFYVEWALDGDGLYKGDRILEVNGKLVTCKTKEELQKLVGNTGKCQMVVLRRKSTHIPQKQLDQEKENNMRLQHRISYLEEQVRELQNVKEQEMQRPLNTTTTNGTNGHVTSISISSPPSTPPEKPLVFQRGNYITTLVGGKPIELIGEEQYNNNRNNNSNNNKNISKTPLSKSNSAHITKTMIKENSHFDYTNERTMNSYMPSKSFSASKISINSDSAYMQQPHKRDKERHRYDRSISKANILQQRANMLARSVEHLNEYNAIENHHNNLCHTEPRNRLPTDMRSVKSLDFDSENESKQANDVDAARTIRPTPPKKPLRLSLQRAQSLLTVELNPSTELERKRALKRAHLNEKTTNDENDILIENCSPLHTLSLGRQKHNL